MKTSLSNLPSRTPLQGLHPQTHQLTTSSRPGDTLRSHIPYSPFPSSNSRKAPCQATDMKAWSLPSQSSLAGWWRMYKNGEGTGVGRDSPVRTCMSQSKKMSSPGACGPPCCCGLLPRQISHTLQGPLLQEAFFDINGVIALL